MRNPTLTTTLTLRRAQPDDWPAVQALLQAHQLPTEGAREHLPCYRLAESQGQLVGCAGVERYGDVALLRSVAVAPGRQHQGVGRQLVQQVLDDAAQQGARHAYLLTTTAPDYFARCGFVHEPIAQAPAALQASAELQGACPASAIFMRRALDAPR